MQVLFAIFSAYTNKNIFKLNQLSQRANSLLFLNINQNFNTDLVKNVSLYTVRNANLDELSKIYENKKVLLEQISKKTVQIVTN